MNRVLFVQLPPPRFSFEEPPCNIPLAAGFLAASVEASRARGLLSETLELAVVREEIVDVLGDDALCRAIVEQRPTVVGLTLYVWNVQRSLFLAANIKKGSPRTIIVVGGPEVTPDNPWVLEHPAVDTGAFGEGESRITALLEALISGRRPTGLEGVFFKDRGALERNTGAPAPWNLECRAYPYLDGIIKPSLDGTLFLETVRGCPFRCRYCYYHKAFRETRNHPRRSMEAALDLAYSPHSRVKEIYLLDPTFNARKGFKSLLRQMARRRSLKDLAIHTELRADLLVADDVGLLKEAGLKSAEVGLQSTNPRALEAAGRSGDPDKIARGVGFLKDAGIEVTTGIILGLPQDTPEGFSRTLEWLKRTGSYTVVHPFALSVLPGTDFRAHASDLGLHYDARPPYYVRSTPTFPQVEFPRGLQECERVFEMELDCIPRPSMVDRGPDLFVRPEEAPYISKWIVNPKRGEGWRRILPRVLEKASDPFTLWFRTGYSENAMSAIVRQFVQTNPHAVLNVILEFPSRSRAPFLEEVLAAVGDSGLFINRSYAPLHGEGSVVSPDFTVILPDPGDPIAREEIADLYPAVAVPVWDQGEILKSVGREMDAPLLISTPAHAMDGQWVRLLRELERIFNDRPEEILFRDATLQQDWNRRVRKLDPAERFPEIIALSL